MSRIIGIDLGTTNSCVAVLEGQEARVIPNAEGSRTTPSVVALGEGGLRLVGTLAKRQAVINPQHTVFSAKRLIGRTFDEVRSEVSAYPFTLKEGRTGDVRIAMAGQEYAPQEISAWVLARLKQSAEDYLGLKVTDAVITVPAYFNDSQRQATKDAGRIAGLNVRRLLNEPTAAALAYGLDQRQDQKIAVFDLGGGTFDISILELGDGVFEVRSTNGHTRLGGDDFDQRIVQWLLSEFKAALGLDLSGDPMAMQRLREAAEKAKIELSSTVSTQIHLPFIAATPAGPRHLHVELTRARFEQMVDDLLASTLPPCRQALADASLAAGQVDEVILVGGMTRMPKVQALVREFFGREPHRGVNPDEVVAMGAAIQAGVLSGDVKDVLLLDVTPLSLGLETRGQVFTRLIERNTTIPTRKSELFSTAEDDQSSVEIHVLQGERELAAFNRTLGRFHLEGLPAAPRGVPQIEVTFDIDANGILHVSAQDRGTGRQQRVRIEACSGLSESEVRRLVRDALEHAAEDHKRREEAERKNHADGVAYRIGRQLREQGARLPGHVHARVNAALEATRSALAGSDPQALERATAALETAWREAELELREPATHAGHAAGEAAGGGPNGPIAADYEVLEDA
jgi:molecular chaperone DnaK